MKRYLIFAAIGPFVGSLLLLFATTVASGYWTETTLSEVSRFFSTFFWTVQYSYLMGVVPALMVGAVDEILLHLPRIRPVVRMLIMGAIGFTASELIYGSRGAESGALQFVLYGLVGCVPAMLSSWLSHKYAGAPALPVHST